MANGKQKSDANWAIFQAWLASKSDDDFRLIQSRGVLSRVEIAKECEFSKSALDQNPRIKNALREKEADLRARGILRPLSIDDSATTSAIPQESRGGVSSGRESARLTRLEQENALLRAEKSELQSQVATLTEQLQRYKALEVTLSMTGRVPR